MYGKRVVSSPLLDLQSLALKTLKVSGRAGFCWKM